METRLDSVYNQTILPFGVLCCNCAFHFCMLKRSKVPCVLHIDVSRFSSLWIWVPDHETKALYKGTIVTSIQANQLVARRDPEMLPPHIRLLLGIIGELAPHLIN